LLLLLWQDLKPEVFQTFREIGNLLILSQLVDSSLDSLDLVKFMQAAPFEGIQASNVISPSPILRVFTHVRDTFKNSAQRVSALVHDKF
jgi:hypothetical protein